MSRKSSAEKQVQPAWERMQQKTFTKWVKTRLRLSGKTDAAEEFNNLFTDLQSGEVVCELIGVLRGSAVKYKKPKSSYAKRDNIDRMLKILDRDNIEHVDIGALDIAEGDKKLTLALIWILILNYDILDHHVDMYVDEDISTSDEYDSDATGNAAVNAAGDAAADAAVKLRRDSVQRVDRLMGGISNVKTSKTRRFSMRDVVTHKKGWSPLKLILSDVNIKLVPYRIEVHNLNTDWKDGLALAALIDRFRPGFFNAMKEKTPEERVNGALDSGKILGIDDLIEAKDILDMKTGNAYSVAMATYLRCFLRTELDKVSIPYTQENWGNYHRARRNSVIVPAMLGLGLVELKVNSDVLKGEAPSEQLGSIHGQLMMGIVEEEEDSISPTSSDDTVSTLSLDVISEEIRVKSSKTANPPADSKEIRVDSSKTTNPPAKSKEIRVDELSQLVIPSDDIIRGKCQEQARQRTGVTFQMLLYYCCFMGFNDD